MKFMNVKEQWFLYDTILVSPWISRLPFQIPGWFSTFLQIGQTDDLSFFTTRNKSIGLAYNNQEARDQIPFALIADSLSVDFFAPSIANHKGIQHVMTNWWDECPPAPGELQYWPQHPEELGGGTIADDLRLLGRVDCMSPFWEAELPQHTSVVFRTNQDERLRTVASMLPPGYGPIGHVRGQGSLNARCPFPPVYSDGPIVEQNPDMPPIGGESGSVNAGGQGRAHLKYRWEFEGGIGIQRRATISVELRFSEWARRVLQSLWGPGQLVFWPYDTTEDVNTPASYPDYYHAAFGIQVALAGRREVQQRGQYHV